MSHSRVVPLDADRAAVHEAKAGRLRVLLATSPQKRRIAEHVSLGCKNSEIARELGCSVDNVRSLLHQTYKRVGLGGRVELGVLFSEIARNLWSTRDPD
ncbi:MAG TPA: sigma factor-like helix-turn-helix DNA-binding protein [Gemmatimonadales bacterium]|jgi:DNA-binding NarL/FixJ family response regulator